MNELEEHLSKCSHLHVQQVFEGFELLGFETRNKYKILDENQRPVAFAAEQATGFGGALMRQFFGHWRSFRVIIFNEKKERTYQLHFPFRWFFKTLFLSEANGRMIGRMEERFAFFRKKFDVYDIHGALLAQINSSFFKFWTFEFFDRGRSIGKIEKRWSGMMSELFTDKDNFVVSYQDPNLSTDMKALMLATCLMVDIVYFEKKGSSVSVMDLGGFD
jgi:uncharacterized protein YxjI